MNYLWIFEVNLVFYKFFTKSRSMTPTSWCSQVPPLQGSKQCTTPPGVFFPHNFFLFYSQRNWSGFFPVHYAPLFFLFSSSHFLLIYLSRGHWQRVDIWIIAWELVNQCLVISHEYTEPMSTTHSDQPTCLNGTQEYDRDVPNVCCGIPYARKIPVVYIRERSRSSTLSRLVHGN